MNTYWAATISMLLTNVALLIALVVTLRRAHRLKILEGEYSPFWKKFQDAVMIALHRPHPESQRLDYLMGKLRDLDATDEEIDEIKELAKAIIKDPNKPAEDRHLAEFLLFAIPRAVREREQGAETKTLETMKR